MAQPVSGGRIAATCPCRPAPRRRPTVRITHAGCVGRGLGVCYRATSGSSFPKKFRLDDLHAESGDPLADLVGDRVDRDVSYRQAYSAGISWTKLVTQLVTTPPASARLSATTPDYPIGLTCGNQTAPDVRRRNRRAWRVEVGARVDRPLPPLLAVGAAAAGLALLTRHRDRRVAITGQRAALALYVESLRTQLSGQ